MNGFGVPFIHREIIARCNNSAAKSGKLMTFKYKTSKRGGSEQVGYSVFVIPAQLQFLSAFQFYQVIAIQQGV